MNAFDPRYNLEAEQLVLGGLMFDATAWDKCGHLLRADDFYRHENHLIFVAIASLVSEGKPCEVVAVAERLQESGQLEAAGGFAGLGQLVANTASTKHIEHYAAVISEKALYRRVMGALTDAAALVQEQSERPVAERVQAVCSMIQDTVEAGMASEVPLLYEHGAEWVASHERMFNSGSQFIGLPTGFSDIDKVTMGMPPGELIVIAARPSMGKSAFALNICSHNAEAGKSVFIASLEMPVSAVMNRFAASVGNVDYSGVRSAKWDEVGHGMTKFAERMRGWKLAVDDRPRLDANRLESMLRAHRRRHGLDLAMVDYLQLMDMGDDTNRVSAVTKLTRDLKVLAGVLQIPIIALSQLNRSCESRPDKRPLMSDLRDSGSIEQDAHTLLFLYRDEVYNPNSDQKGITEVIIAKARDSERGVIVPLATQLNRMRFANFSRGYEG